MDLPPKWRFKLERLKRQWRENRDAQKANYDTSLRMCPSCRALVARNESVCPDCGAKLKSPRARAGTGAEGRFLGVLPMPSSGTSLLGGVCIVLYILSWFMTERMGGAPAGGGMFGLFSYGDINTMVLVRLGAKYGPLMFAGQWWRLVTAIFLHAGLLHIGMNMWVLFDLGPEVESLFCTTKYVVIFLVTGIFGYIVSLWWMPGGISIGASGALMGLIGALIAASYRHGQLGKEYRSMLWRWVLYIAILGLFFSFDNAAHLGGLISGLALGYLVPEGEPDSGTSENLWNTLAILSVIIIAGSFALMALHFNLPFG